MPYLRRLPSGKWRAEYRDPSGRRRSLTRPTKSQARAEALDREAEVRSGGWRDPTLGRITLGAWYARWAAARVAEDTTLAKAASIAGNHVLPHWKDVRLDQFSPLEVQAWIARLQRDGVGAETVRSAHGLLAAVVDAAVRERLIPANITRGVNLPTVSKQPDRFLTEAEVDAILSALDDERDQAMVLLAAYTGLRWAELAGLHSHRVDMLRRQLHVVETAKRSGEIKAYPKSKAGFRTVPLVDRVLDPLSSRLTEELVFPGRDGRPISYSNWRRRRWAPAAKAVAKPYPTFHDLRHTYASWLVQRGVDLRTVQVLMGHESLVTVQRYSHLAPDVHDKVRQALDAPATHAPAGKSAAGPGPKRKPRSEG